MNRDETRQWLIDRNREYRIGKPTVSDPYFDNIYKDFCDKYPDDILAQKNILEEIPIDDADKVKLPIPMFSLNKIKTMQALYNWAETKKIPNDAELILTSKYDSISLCVSEEYSLAYTRGDGEYGLPRNEHLRDIQAYSIMNCSNVNKHNMYTYGEAIIPKQIWIDKFENKINPYNNKLFKNGRNTVAGLFNNKTNITELLNDVVYMRYGLVDDESENLKKSQILDKLNTLNVIEVPYLIVKLNDPELETIINNQFEIWKEYFEIDGIVIELNDPELRKKLGREDNNNPAWARAFKNPAWAQVEQTTVNKLEINISKQGILNPVLIIDPVYIGGAEIKRATGYNMKYMLENNICVGSTVEIIRSGEVIPKHINTLSFDKESFEKFSESIKKCPCCGSDTYWGDTKVDLICSNSKCPSRVLNSLIFFFGVIDIEKFGEGEISKLYNLGYDTPEKILNLTYNDLINIDGWGNSKISTLLNQFNKYKTDGIPLAKLMQALDLFKGKLGEKTAQKIFDEYNDLSNLNIEELNTIEGVSDITANVFIDAYTKYLETYQNYIVKVSYIKTPKKEIIGDKYINMSICMTGFRDDELSNLIQSHGGKIVSGVSKKTTHLLVKDLNSESNKATKARELGIPIMTKDEFLNL